MLGSSLLPRQVYSNIPQKLLSFFTFELEESHWVPCYWLANLGAKRNMLRYAATRLSVENLFKMGVVRKDQMLHVGGDAVPYLRLRRAEEVCVAFAVGVGSSGL